MLIEVIYATLIDTQRTTFSDLKWPFHALCAISAVAELLAVNCCTIVVDCYVCCGMWIVASGV